jgi:hypothetical protein
MLPCLSFVFLIKIKKKQMQLNPVLRVFGLIVILLFSLTTYIFWETKFGRSSRFEQYLEIIYRVSIVVTIFGVFYSIQANYKEILKTDREKLAQTELDIGREISNTALTTEQIFALDPSAKDLHRLFVEIYGSSPCVSDNYNVDNLSLQDQKEIIFLLSMFRRIEQALIVIQIEQKVQSGEWLRLWKTWFRSPTVQKVWNRYSCLYSRTMQEYVARHLLG